MNDNNVIDYLDDGMAASIKISMQKDLNIRIEFRATGGRLVHFTKVGLCRDLLEALDEESRTATQKIRKLK